MGTKRKTFAVTRHRVRKSTRSIGGSTNTRYGPGRIQTESEARPMRFPKSRISPSLQFLWTASRRQPPGQEPKIYPRNIAFWFGDIFPEPPKLLRNGFQTRRSTSVIKLWLELARHKKPSPSGGKRNVKSRRAGPRCRFSNPTNFSSPGGFHQRRR